MERTNNDCEKKLEQQNYSRTAFPELFNFYCWPICSVQKEGLAVFLIFVITNRARRHLQRFQDGFLQKEGFFYHFQEAICHVSKEKMLVRPNLAVVHNSALLGNTRMLHCRDGFLKNCCKKRTRWTLLLILSRCLWPEHVRQSSDEFGCSPQPWAENTQVIPRYAEAQTPPFSVRTNRCSLLNTNICYKNTLMFQSIKQPAAAAGEQSSF